MTGPVFLSISIVGAVTVFVRILPFLFFRQREVPRIVRYLEGHLPPMVMIILVVYSVRNIQWLQAPYGIPVILAIVLVTVLHLWKGNPLLSIFGGTVFYMAVVQTGVLENVVVALPF